ncbi:hypothetical protein SOP94_17780 [Peribacillus frigoritolerans]|uniref:hypothetical protein n=1 Tax=Peribacillus frigoritolerans TaxID=450367 RepID=UPI002B24C14E|nr:hypothetical protein [Peribacillus frigoritolerans]MEB2630307.1 hypothetical protein [Peribacillus frigoritolerans]
MIQSNTFNSIGMVLSKFYTELIEAKGTRLLLRKIGETPQAQAEEAPRPVRGKRVPGAEINVQIVQTNKKSYFQ